jgi:apolipoprotein N-acyltransferase
VPSAPPPAPLFGLRAAYALAVLSGLVYFLGVPGSLGALPGAPSSWAGASLWPAAFVAFVPLLLAIRGRSPATAARIGLASGTVASALGFYWLYGMLKLFSGFPVPVCLILMLATCAYQGGRTAVASWLTARAAVHGWPAAAAFVLASTTADLLYPLLFPWYLAFMMHRTPILMQTADLGGVYLAGALLLGPNVALAELWRARIERARASRLVVALGFLAPLAGAAYGAVRMKQVEAREAGAQAITVGLAQGNLPLITRENGVEIHRRLTEDLRDRGAHLVVWSEGSVPDVFNELHYTPGTHFITKHLSIPILFGAGVRRRVGDHERELNSALLADADGKIVGRYDKHYLLPFGEFIPFGETFPSLYARSPNSGHMIPGDSVKPLVLAGHPITVLICYEDILPWFVNRAVSEGRPELLVNMTIDTWFGRTIEPWEHLALAQFRAVEHRRYLVRSANSGISAIVDPEGRVREHGGLFDEEALLGEVRLMAPVTVYEVVGDAPFYLGALVIGAMAMFRRRPDEVSA